MTQRNPDPTRSCDGKVKHTTRAKARAAKRRTPGIHDVYRCAACGWWHIGHRLRILRCI